MMKKRIVLLGLIFLFLMGCTPAQPQAQIAATTLPVYEFSSRLCAGTGLSVTRLVTESVSCLHDYSLSVSQMRSIAGAEVVVLSGGGLEDFLMDTIGEKSMIDSAEGISLLGCGHVHEHDHDRAHEYDAHIWLSTANAKLMAGNISKGLTEKYPQYSAVFASNLTDLLAEIEDLESYGKQQLADLQGRELITFHDGFAYFADCFDLTILEAVEEESGSEASAAELKHLIGLAQEHGVKAVFTEKNGSASAADILSAELGVKSYPLDMAMSGDSWYGAMVYNIKTVKEALG